MKDRLKKILPKAVGLALITAAIIAAVANWQLIWGLITSAEARNEFAAFMRTGGIKGFTAFLGLQMLQILIPAIPGEPVEIIAGIVYGTAWGLIACLLGVALGTIIIYYMVKMLGAKSVKEDTLAKYKFLKEKKNIELILFILFFIPGTPKDTLIYLGPFLPVKPRSFFLISIFARIPSVVTSTYAGASLIKGNYTAAVIVFVVTGILGLTAILYHEKILNWLKHKKG